MTPEALAITEPDRETARDIAEQIPDPHIQWLVQQEIAAALAAARAGVDSPDAARWKPDGTGACGGSALTCNDPEHSAAAIVDEDQCQHCGATWITCGCDC